MKLDKFLQDLLGLGITLSAHVDIGNSGERVRGIRLKGQDLLIFLFGVGKTIRGFQYLSGREKRLRIAGLKLRRVPKGLECPIGIGFFRKVPWERNGGSLPLLD